jgi:hypothetical protein
VSSADDDALILELWRQDLSIRQIAKRSGFSRPKVDRALARLVPAFGSVELEAAVVGAEDDDDEGAEALFASDPERVVVPPLLYVGAERVRGKLRARWVDTVGPADDLDIYRYRYRNGSVADHELDADMARQLIAAGWWQLDHAGYHAEWMPPPKPADTRCSCPGHREPATVWSYGPNAGMRYDADADRWVAD